MSIIFVLVPPGPSSPVLPTEYVVSRRTNGFDEPKLAFVTVVLAISYITIRGACLPGWQFCFSLTIPDTVHVPRLATPKSQRATASSNTVPVMQPALAPRISQPTSSSAVVSMGMAVPQDHVQSEHVLREQFIPPPPDRIDTNMSQQSPSSPNDPHGADGMTGSPDSDGAENNGDGRKGYGKRELSTSKRAAQNRAAQRAFRQRKEGYIKKLEEQVRDYQMLSEKYKVVQAENYQLRDYIINLQSRLLESQGEVPPPPSNIENLQPGKAGQVQSLPRLSELGAVGSQQDGISPVSHEHPRTGFSDSSYSESAAKRVRTSSAEMTPSQAALQGPSILSQSPTGAR